MPREINFKKLRYPFCIYYYKDIFKMFVLATLVSQSIQTKSIDHYTLYIKNL